MPYEVDPRFKTASSKAQSRSRARRLVRFMAVGAVLGVCFLLAGGLWFVLRPAPGGPVTVAVQQAEDTAASDASTEDLTMVADAERPTFDARATFIDLAKDPLILTFAEAAVDGADDLRETPLALDVRRAGSHVKVIEDALVVQSRRMTTALPSSRADFAYFQAARGDAMSLLQNEIDEQDETLGEVEAGDIVTVDGDDGSWGALLPALGGGLREPDEATYVETSIENTTSLKTAVSEVDRFTLYQDEIIVTTARRPLLDVLGDAGLGRVHATLTQRAAMRMLRLQEVLDPGMVIALRLRPAPRGAELLQISVYAGADHIGTLAQVTPGDFEVARDPWFDVDLLAQSRAALEEAEQVRDIRLLDAIYSAGLRNGLSSSLVGEMMVMLAQNEDLDRFASSEDRFLAVIAPEPGVAGQGAGQLLYVGVRGPSGAIDCHVVLSPSRENFECYKARIAANQLGGIGAGMVVPVNGTRTSPFGPRFHPILKEMRAHNGVDWGAPTGTPVRAAADGTVTRANVNGGYGNVVYIRHSGARETRYAHLDSFAAGIRPNVAVTAGQVIGSVGTTGRSTGPHLHFELRVDGRPVDPLTYTGPPTVVVQATTGSGAVEALVNQIIRVESAGNANAANPNSTARGLGQFIESTWLRMIAIYRPDLNGLSRADKLALRFDPDLSREMVRHLAREGESYLRNRGHSITAGRLYLAHFLGAEGAHVALSAAPDASVASVMGRGVVNANGFLRGRDIRWMTNWAERKMAPMGGGAAPAPQPTPIAQPEPMSQEVTAYIDAVDAIVDEVWTEGG